MCCVSVLDNPYKRRLAPIRRCFSNLSDRRSGAEVAQQGAELCHSWPQISHIVVDLQPLHGTIPAMIPRHATAQLRDALADTPVVYLQGARQTGKSTLVKSLAEQSFASYSTLDTATVLAAATDDPDGFVRGLARPTVIDEVQRAPALAVAIKAAVDADRRAGQFLLTGSASALALPRLAESLAGRMESHTLWPLSQGEINGTHETFIDRLFAPELVTPRGTENTEDAVIDRICTGGYPEARTRRAGRRRGAWFDAYIDAILQRDVRELANIDRLLDVPRLLGLLASRTGQLINHADLARTIGLPQSTLKRYMALLETTFLVQRLPAWFTSIGKRLAKAPKLMLVDTALLIHLLEVDAARLRRDRTLLGHVLENFVAMEVTKQLGWCQRRCQLFHFRTSGGAEVDLVIENRAGQLVGVEVKCTATLRTRDFVGLKALAEIAGDRFVRGVVMYLGSEVVPFGKALHGVPIAQVWT